VHRHAAQALLDAFAADDAEAHGGTVVFEPIDSPTGARFVLRLPLAAETESLPT
jgi:signal transduction histidine kinase